LAGLPKGDDAKTCNSLLALPALVLALGIGSAMAAPAGGVTGLAAQDDASLVLRTLGCHRSCEWGIGRGWHRHVGPACAPV
jgi:hypothetical protein